MYVCFIHILKTGFRTPISYCVSGGRAPACTECFSEHPKVKEKKYKLQKVQIVDRHSVLRTNNENNP